jgi:ABC-2 type transport system permease protein
MSLAIRAVQVELRKMTTTRTWWVLGGSMAVYVSTLAAFITWSFTLTPKGAPAGTPSVDDPVVLQALYTSAASLGYVFPAVLGVLVITTEYRYQTLSATFLAISRRPLVLTAKLVAALAVGLVVALLAVTVTVPSVAGVLAASGHPTGLSDPDLRATLARSVIALVLWSGLGLGLGLVVRNQVVAVVALITASQLVEPLLRLGLGAWGPTRAVARFLPGAASDGLSGASVYAIGRPRTLLDPWQGGLVLLAYAIVLTGFGIVATTRRDVV